MRFVMDSLGNGLVLLFVMMLVMGAIHKCCEFHELFQKTRSQLESEEWLVRQCKDPVFFSNMHTHTDLCHLVENNARVGAVMLTLREVLQSDVEFLMQYTTFNVRSVFSWQIMLCLGLALILCPSWLVCGTRVVQRRWPVCLEGHYKDA